MNKVIQRSRLFGEARFAEEKYGDDHAEPAGQVRPLYLRYMAVCTIDYSVQSVLDHNVEHGANISVPIRSDEHSYGRLLRIHGWSEQRNDVFFILH